ncbi:uncharacterized protein LOC132745167 [Ruditapes philippinarum]|uniref:uncharacterized protein LOC132745167 n=1 Tax=Ruditapes philippinarum TaxID=129788 RepID=UPI00295ADC8E|nr:uncharacterized protein LOC132745167 [Ruditapes philippinarum]
MKFKDVDFKDEYSSYYNFEIDHSRFTENFFEYEQGQKDIIRYACEVDGLPDVLVEKVSSLPELLKQSKADSTYLSYKRGFNRWRKWVISNGLNSGEALPAKAFHVALYIVSLIQTANTISPILNAVYSIKWYHDLFEFPSPTDSRLVKNVVEGGKRKLAKPIHKKEPMAVELLHKMFSHMYAEKNIMNQRFICICLIAFAGFLRSAEVLKLKRSDICFYDSYLSIFIESSKTDKYREGVWVLIARIGTCLCPVANLEKYICWTGIRPDSECFLFGRLTATKDGHVLRNQDKPLSYSNFRDLFVQTFKKLVDDVNKFCSHSLRAGGATAAANNGIPDRLFKRHGRWHSETAKDGYVKSSVDERLRVSKYLGL